MAVIHFLDESTGQYVPVEVGATSLAQLTDTTDLATAADGSPMVYAATGKWGPITSAQQARVSRVRPHSGAALRLMDDGGNVRLRLNSSAAVFFSDSTINGGGSGVIGIANATTVPTASVTGAALLYSEAGILKVRNQGAAAAPVAVLSDVEALREEIAVLRTELAALRGGGTGSPSVGVTMVETRP